MCIRRVKLFSILQWTILTKVLTGNKKWNKKKNMSFQCKALIIYWNCFGRPLLQDGRVHRFEVRELKELVVDAVDLPGLEESHWRPNASGPGSAPDSNCWKCGRNIDVESCEPLPPLKRLAISLGEFLGENEDAFAVALIPKDIELKNGIVTVGGILEGNRGLTEFGQMKKYEKVFVPATKFRNVEALLIVGDAEMPVKVRAELVRFVSEFRAMRYLFLHFHSSKLIAADIMKDLRARKMQSAVFAWQCPTPVYTSLTIPMQDFLLAVLKRASAIRKPHENINEGYLLECLERAEEITQTTFTDERLIKKNQSFERNYAFQKPDTKDKRVCLGVPSLQVFRTNHSNQRVRWAPGEAISIHLKTLENSYRQAALELYERLENFAEKTQKFRDRDQQDSREGPYGEEYWRITTQYLIASYLGWTKHMHGFGDVVDRFRKICPEDIVDKFGFDEADKVVLCLMMTYDSSFPPKVMPYIKFNRLCRIKATDTCTELAKSILASCFDWLLENDENLSRPNYLILHECLGNCIPAEDKVDLLAPRSER